MRFRIQIPSSTVDFDVRPFSRIVPLLQEIIKKDEDIGALRASLKRANDEAAKREDDLAAVRGEAEALRKELAAAAEGRPFNAPPPFKEALGGPGVAGAGSGQPARRDPQLGGLA